MQNAWPAPRLQGPVDAAVQLPGSKSLTNRALVLAALAEGPSLLRRALRSRDTDLMVAALRSLGAGIDAAGADWHVSPSALRGPAAVDCGLAGTVMRFVPPLAALATGPVDFDGDPRARRRPMAPLLAALRDLGVDVQDEQRGALPFRVHGQGRVPGGTVVMDASESSQFVSGLLLAGARYESGVDVQHHGSPIPSTPHLQMTVRELRRRGVDVDTDQPNRWAVRPGVVKALDADIEPDLSNAAPFVAAALVTGGRCRVRHWPEATDQAGDALVAIAQAMGARAERDGTDMVVTGSDRIQGVHLDLRDAGELAPVVAAVCALASGPSELTGLAHLRGHETDRLAALATQLNRLGGRVTELPEGLRIDPAPLHGDVFATYADHRMAQAGAVLGLRVDGVVLDDVEACAKTFPDFAATWRRFVA